MKVPLETEFEKEHVRRMLAYNLKIDRIFNHASKDIAVKINQFKLKHPVDYTGNFYKWNRTLEKRIDSVLSNLNNNLLSGIQEQMTEHWNLSNLKNGELEKAFLKGTGVTTSFGKLNLHALDTFINRTENGMNLSKRVWKIINGTKTQLETYLGSGITTGKSAIDISKEIEKFISGGGVRYRGKLIKAGNRKFEAIRLASTETNLAYRMSDYTRRQQLPFVTGIIVHLSDQHPRDDICDEMQGEYPVGFIFTGWHPLCICYSTSKLLSEKEFQTYLNTGELPQGQFVQSIPARANNYLQKNADTIKNWKSKPYWFRDNFNDSVKLKKSA